MQHMEPMNSACENKNTHIRAFTESKYVLTSPNVKFILQIFDPVW